MAAVLTFMAEFAAGAFTAAAFGADFAVPVSTAAFGANFTAQVSTVAFGVELALDSIRAFAADFTVQVFAVSTVGDSTVVSGVEKSWSLEIKPAPRQAKVLFLRVRNGRVVGKVRSEGIDQ